MKRFAHKFSAKKNSFSKKGQIEISFNWIFILIAGAVILGFFIVVTKNQKEDSQEQTSRSISGKLDSLLAAIQQNPDSVQIQDTLNVEMEFHCDVTGHYYQLKDSSSQSALESQIIFTPEIVGDAKTIAWTQMYSSPYPVAYILYFTDEKTKYIFVESNQKIKDLYLKMPALFVKNFTTKETLAGMEDQGYRKYVIITDGSDITLKTSVQKKATIISFSDNKVYFKENSGSHSTGYPNEAALYGAIVSGDVELYGCSMESLMQASRIVGEINLERTKRTRTILYSQLSEKCKLFYVDGLAEDYIEAIIENSRYAEDENYADLISNAASLEAFNRNLARSNCPTIY